MYLSVIVPAYNEEKNLAVNIGKFNNYLSRQSYNYEIIIVNDGSTDKTGKIAGKLIAENKNLKLINNKENQGKGAAVRQGLLFARGEYRLFIDADNATSIEHIDKIWPKFKNDYDIVIGSRSPKDAEGARQALAQPIWKRFLGVCGNRFIQTLTVKGIYDTQCGFKAFTKRAAEEIIPKITINRWGFDVEILVIARISGYKIAVIPVHWINSPNSRVGVKGYFLSLLDVVKIKWNLMIGKYNK
ncbi:MAG: glycosyltransferase [Actinobacteria bacterium]|nr:glycosyltransferase [Actinomycetota bacterium]